MVNKTDAPIFIVGASRSGNTLIQEALNRHGNIHVSSETHWFDDERCQRQTPIVTESDCVFLQNWFMALAHQPFGHSGDPEQGWLKRCDLEYKAQELAKLNGSESRDSYFSAYCTLDAEKRGKARWGEKTPRHIFRINDILQAFPHAKVISMIRDPRSMVASYRQWSVRESHDLYSDKANPDLLREKERSRDSYHPVIASMLWRGATRSALAAIEQHGSDNVRAIRYESLVSEPNASLRDITGWLGESFDSSMLEVPTINSSYDEYQSDTGFHQHAIDRWRNQLSSSELAVIQLICSREMKSLGIIAETKGTARIFLQAIPQLVTLPVSVYRAWRANRDRTGNLLTYIWRRISI